MIEKVQVRATKLAPSAKKISYKERLINSTRNVETQKNRVRRNASPDPNPWSGEVSIEVLGVLRYIFQSIRLSITF